MFYNYLLGQTASFLGNLLGRSLVDLEPRSYSLSEIQETRGSGLFFKTERDGSLFRVGFYLTHYNDVVWGRRPVIHIDFCDNVKELKHRMRATNSPIVTYYSKDNKTTHKDVHLKICKKCLTLLEEKTSISFSGRSFSEFVLALEEDERYKCNVQGEDGYAINWRQLSRAFREIKNFTCEYCGFQIDDFRFTKFLQTHHVDSYNKMNNKRSNLKCLCVKCHSEVDEYHRRQFSTIENQILLAEFDEYRKQNAS